MRVMYGGADLTTLGGQPANAGVAYFRRAEVLDGFGNPLRVTVTIGIKGEVCIQEASSTQDGQDKVDLAIADLNSITRAPSRVALQKDDNTDTDIKMIASETIAGIRLSRDVSYDVKSRADFVTGIPWSIEVEGDYNVNASDSVISRAETLQVSGGPARVLFNETISGSVKSYTTAAVTTGILIQSGTIVGRDAHVAIPAPLDPPTYLAAESNLGVATPNYLPGGQPYGFARTYSLVHKKSGAYNLPALPGYHPA